MQKKRSFPLRISSVNVVKCDQFRADLATFTEEILNEILHFSCSDDGATIRIQN